MKYSSGPFTILRGLLVAVLAAFPLTLGLTAAAETPHTIKIIVPLPPGGAGDILARVLAEQIGRTDGRGTRNREPSRGRVRHWD